MKGGGLKQTKMVSDQQCCMHVVHVRVVSVHDADVYKFTQCVSNNVSNELLCALTIIIVAKQVHLFCPSSTAVPTHITNITVNHAQKTISWTAPIEPNGIIVRYRVQYWELGRRDTAEEYNTTTAEGLMFSYGNFSKCYTTS